MKRTGNNTKPPSKMQNEELNSRNSKPLEADSTIKKKAEIADDTRATCDNVGVYN
jgi:hypothetical protein